VAAVFLVAFGIKAAAFPLYFWLPAAYPTPPVAVTAIFSALLTKVGVYALVRTFTLVFVHDQGFTHGIILAAGILTMLVGVLGAVAQNEIRRILSVHIVSQIGYMLVGLALLTPLALAGLVFMLAHNIFVKTTLFLMGGVVRATCGSFELARLGGLWRARPVLAVLFLLAAFSLAGFPPFSGFWAKLILVRAGLETEALLTVGAALLTGLLTTFSMTKIWSEAFWKDPPAGTAIVAIEPGQRIAMMLPVLGLSALALAMGLLPEPFIALARRAADELVDPTAYVTAVLGAQVAQGIEP
jgi:multicomponent Na+:H+ antiporter subunit D